MGKGVDADPMGLDRMPREELEDLCRELEEEVDQRFNENRLLKAQIAEARDIARPTMFADADNRSIASVVQLLVEENDHKEREAEEMRQKLLAKIRAAEKSAACAAEVKPHPEATAPAVGG